MGQLRLEVQCSQRQVQVLGLGFLALVVISCFRDVGDRGSRIWDIAI